MTAKARLVLAAGSTDHCLSFSIHHVPEAGLYSCKRFTEDGESIGYYNDEKVAVRELKTWLSDQIILADRAQRAIEQQMRAELDRIEAGGCLSHIPSQCGCGDCLTQMAGDPPPPKDHHSGDDCDCAWCNDDDESNEEEG